MKNILIIAAHIDDAELGMGGTIAKLSKDNNITLCILCKGNRPGEEYVEVERKKALNKNIKTLHIDKLIINNYNDVSLDTIPHIELTTFINKIINDIKPSIVFTHCENDIHIDHNILSKAVKVSCRPRNNNPVKALYEFSIPGSTEWSFKNTQFNTYIDITEYANKKYKCISRYYTELNDLPDPLNINFIQYRDYYYGSISGNEKAEPFRCIFKKYF
jgi:LmbE family N-acetylglucosaminyl deacetylase